MATQTENVEEPEFISFLFSSKLKHDCFFLVGNKNQMKPERIGVVKAMLMAHSVVLRLELEDSELAEKEEVPVPDIYPETFRNLLRYVYGQDKTAALCFDEADNLLYVAEKYMMATLKKKLATRLMFLLTPENICSLMNNPACYSELELNSAITQILRYETDRVLASPPFLDLNPDGFVKILEQDGLNVPEIELWRAMMKWAKHNVCTEDGSSLRKQCSRPMKYVKICTLECDQFCKEVAPTNILTMEEIATVCISIGKQEKTDNLNELCNDVIPRKLLDKRKKFILQFTEHELSSFTDVHQFNFTVVTKNSDIELMPLKCLALKCPSGTPEGATYDVICTITITWITDRQNETCTKTPVTVRLNKQVGYGTTFKIPLISEGHNVTLLANNKYTFSMLFGGDQKRYYDDPRTSMYDNSHMSLHIEQHGIGLHYVPMKCLKYKADDV